MFNGLYHIFVMVPHENNHNWGTSEMAEESSAAASLATWRAKSKSPTCAWRSGCERWKCHGNFMGSRAMSMWLSTKILGVN